jgi:hypothetical protein
LSKDGLDEESEQYTSSQTSTSASLTMKDINRWSCHTNLKRFGESLQTAAKAVFPNDKKVRYSKATVLMLSWADEDPQLPVSLEIEKSETTFRAYYHYEVEHFLIPDEDCHFEVAAKVMKFVKPEADSKAHLKIVYYAGHARLLDTRALALTRYDLALRKSLTKLSSCP